MKRMKKNKSNNFSGKKPSHVSSLHPMFSPYDNDDEHDTVTPFSGNINDYYNHTNSLINQCLSILLDLSNNL